eukprot:m.18411 g.18411  ORF g.18411 m.18411 type:complete len:213 (+) comp10805_c0_seq1:160-798(+)
MTIELFVKASPDGTKLGDCPFCHKAAMALRAKGVEYQEVYIDTSNKPDSFLALTAAGTTPVLRDGETVLTESEDIVEFAEKQSGPSIKSSDAAKNVGSAIFAAMKPFFLNTDSSKDPELQKAVDSVFEEINTHLLVNKTKFLDGDTITHADMSLLPKLFHALTVLEHEKQYAIPDIYPEAKAYVEAGFDNDVFKATAYPKEYILKGWLAKKQ